MYLTLMIFIGCPVLVSANDVSSTNSVQVDLSGWEEPEVKPPKKPAPPTGQEIIIPTIPQKQIGYDKNGFLPQTGEIKNFNLLFYGIQLVIIALVALIYIKKYKHTKGEN